MTNAPVVVKSLITPQDQTLRTVFNKDKSFQIDIYQREYKWSRDQVETLLTDIEVRFSQHDRRSTQFADIQEDVQGRFEPYFLNTYLTQGTATRTLIVDGQQRLTTLLLILIKLYQVLTDIEKDPALKGKTFSSNKIEKLIFETDDSGEAQRFKIFNPNREQAFRALIERREVEPLDETRQRIKENFEIISKYFEAFLRQREDGTYDLVKTTYYITYLLDRISIVEIRIERQENVAMVFEVVNDRGLGLKPYEILKGKLLGALPDHQKEPANQVWMELQERYFATTHTNTTERTIDLDLLSSGRSSGQNSPNSETDYERFEGAYHYEMYRDKKIQAFFGNFQDRALLFRRITEDLHYFADLYYRLRTSYTYEHLIYNKLLDQNQQYLLLLSNIQLKDHEETVKIAAVARKLTKFT